MVHTTITKSACMLGLASSLSFFSPPQGHIDGDAWWTRYQPTNYNFESRSGSRTEFQSMVQRCKAAGVQIYVDAVINHMAAWNRSFPEVPYSYNDFHSCTSDINYGDRWQVRTVTWLV